MTGFPDEANMLLHIDNHSALRIGVAIVLSGGLLLLYARLLFGPFPKGRG